MKYFGRLAVLIGAVSVALAADKKAPGEDIPAELKKGMMGEVRSVDIATEDDCDMHRLRGAQWERLQASGVVTDFVKCRVGYQVILLAGEAETVKKIQAAVTVMVKQHEELVNSAERTLCRNCFRMKMMGELGNISLEAVSLKQGAIVWAMTGIEKLVPELQQYGEEEYRWFNQPKKVPPPSPKK